MCIRDRDIAEDINANGIFDDDDSDGDGIPDIIDSDSQVFVASKVFLQGVYDKAEGLMRDDLRQKGYLPIAEPFTTLEIGGVKPFVHVGLGGGEIVADGVFAIEGQDAIVDWIFLELRPSDADTMVLQTRAALIQRDGDIVDTDGVSPVSFPVLDGRYYLVLKHRNHLGIMTALPVDLTRDKDNPITLDFTDGSTLTWGKSAQKEIEGNEKTFVLWGGNTDGNRFLIYQGSGVGLPDSDGIFFTIFLDEANEGRIFNHITQGYYLSDTNLDGDTRYQGLSNDIDELIFFNVLNHPDNPNFFTNFFIEEQVPVGSK